jgi:hypothetical protein
MMEQRRKNARSAPHSIPVKTVQMEVTHLAHLQHTSNKDSSARWVCLHDDDGTNYWFISDNEMGAGLLSASHINNGIHKECAKTTEPVSSQSLMFHCKCAWEFTHCSARKIAKKKAMLFYQETPVQNGFIQSNTVSYYFDGEKVRGVIIGQITSN